MSRSILAPIANLVLLEHADHAVNQDLIPMPPSRRLWGWQSYAGLWTMNGLCYSAWTALSSLLSLGLNIPNCIGVMVVSNLLITTLAVICGQIGADWHIGFSITQRVVFGNHWGSVVTVAVRIILSIVSFASNAWSGALCVNCVLSALSENYLNMSNSFPASVNMTQQELIGFIIYLVITGALFFIRPEKLGKHLVACGIITFFVSLGIVSWAVSDAGGNGPLVNAKMELSKSGVGWAWLNGISSFYGSMASGIANQNDYSRYARSRHSPQLAIHITFNVFGLVIPVMGLIAASAMQGKYGEEFWMPNQIIMFWMQQNYSAKARAGAFFAGISFLYSQILYNAAGNGVSGGMDLASLFPRVINIRRGAFLTLLLSWVVQPWLFYGGNSSSSAAFQTVMGSFSVFITPLIAVLICDYWIVRKRKVKLHDLYDVGNPESIYHYWHQVNFRAVVAWTLGFVWGIPGLLQAANTSIKLSVGWVRMYDLNWITGFVISFTLYYAFCRIWPVAGVGETDEYDYLNTFTPEECEKLGMLPFSPEILKGEPEELKLAAIESNPELVKQISLVDDVVELQYSSSDHNSKEK